jgi:predicted permease
MSWFRRVANAFRSHRVSADVDDELSFHLDELTDELMARGLSRQEARREARRRFGSYTGRREETTDMDVARWLDAGGRDLRYAARQLLAAPGFTLVAVLSLALGIGANSAIFQLINALGLRGLPVRDAQELVAIDSVSPFYASGWSTGRHRVFTYAQVEQMSRQQEAFSGLLAFATTRFNLSAAGDAHYAEGLFVTPNVLDVLGVAPALGAWLPADADPRDCSRAGALLDHAFWQREYGGDPGAIGREIRLNGRPFRILAVTPRPFFGLEPGRRFDVALPVCADGLLADDGQGRVGNRIAWWLTPVGRLKPGWTVERADAHLRAISPALFRESQPDAYEPEGLARYLQNRVTVVPAHAGVSDLRRQYGAPLWILLASTGLVLLIACANLANLLLARATAREREVALRQALGASRGRLVTQLMLESALLATAGTAVGVWLAHLLGRGIVWFLAAAGETLDVPLGVDWRVVGFTAGLAVATTVLFGLAPALRATKSAPVDAMRGGRGAAASADRHGFRRALVVAQIALSLVLLVGALLLGRSLHNLMSADIGFVSKNVLLAEVTASLPDVDAAGRLGIFRQLRQGIEGLPEVEAASLVMFSPFSGLGWNEDVHADSDASQTGGRLAWFNRVGPGYFGTLGIPVLAGRDIADQDSAAGERVAVVNEKFARDVFDSIQAVGRRFRYDAYAGEADPVFRIVGVVGNTKYNAIREAPRAIAFLPLEPGDSLPGNRLSVVIRSRGETGSVTAGVKQRLREVDPRLLVEFHSLDDQMTRTVLRERLVASLSEAFGLLALLLSMLGLYGVMSYVVARRRTEIGVRMALGARSGAIVRMVSREVGWLVAMGLALGLAGSFAMARYLESLLFGLAPHDAATLAAGSVLLALTAFAAAFIPMRRATKVDPAIVLRSD